MTERIAYKDMSDRERQLRHDLAELLASAALVRGTLAERAKSCGKPNCRCARGEKHQAFYLVASEEGKPKQLSIPKRLKDRVGTWAQTYKQIREILEELSKIHWDRIKSREM